MPIRTLVATLVATAVLVAPRPPRVALKVNLQYASEAESGLPKAVVDEVDVLTGGPLGKRGLYFAEEYVVDGGLPGRSRDLWAAWRATPDGAPTCWCAAASSR